MSNVINVAKRFNIRRQTADAGRRIANAAKPDNNLLVQAINKSHKYLLSLVDNGTISNRIAIDTHSYNQHKFEKMNKEQLMTFIKSKSV